jgi:hypothetical protein
MPLPLSKQVSRDSSATLLVLVGVSCGSTTPRLNDAVVVTVFGTPIRTSSVDQWISVFSAERHEGLPIAYEPPSSLAAF